MAGALYGVGALAASVPGLPHFDVYPSGPVVPENLLRVSLVFRGPPDAERLKVELCDADRKPLAQALYPQALWSSDGRILTLILDPGRVKTGLVAHEERGRAPTISRLLGLCVNSSLAKQWNVVAERNEPLRPQTWRMSLPQSGSREVFQLTVDAPLDRQALWLIGIQFDGGFRISGRATWAHDETVWRFKPDRPWRAGSYTLRLHPDLEDPQGNRVDEAFEERTAPTANDDHAIAFTIPARRAVLDEAMQHSH